MQRAGEFQWIEKYFAPLASANSFCLKDDASLLDVPQGMQLVVTQDAVLEGVHFLTSDAADWVARKALRVNISDSIAKGATPFAYSLALGVPERWQDADVAHFAKGLLHDQEFYKVQLTGGDTYRSPERLCVAITLFGAVPEGGYISRLGAQEGDLVFVSGTIGDAALGLKVAMHDLKLSSENETSLLNAYRLPNPPLSLAPIISQYCTGSMDISDGLLGDCRKLCDASQLACQLQREQIPLSQAVQNALEKDPALWSAVLTGGDDYQCLCTVAPHNVDAFLKAARTTCCPMAEIGKMTALKSKNEAQLVSLRDRAVPISFVSDSYTHF